MAETYAYRATRTISGLFVVQRRPKDWFTWSLYERGFPSIEAAERRAGELNGVAHA